MQVKKTGGQREDFDRGKFCKSLTYAGAPVALAQKVCAIVEGEISPGITTNELFRKAARYLVREDFLAGAQYRLRRAVGDLGPAGFIFEQYLEIILQAYGYTTERNVIVQGECVTHEIDIIARKDNRTFYVEAKYHNERGLKTHIDRVMYMEARVEDIARRKVAAEGERDRIPWLVTNTKCTQHAIMYAKCRHFKLTGWDFPHQESLKDIIVQKKLFPVTVLPSVNRAAREVFAQHNMLLAQDLLPFQVTDLVQLGVSEHTAERILREAQRLMSE